MGKHGTRTCKVRQILWVDCGIIEWVRRVDVYLALTEHSKIISLAGVIFVPIDELTYRDAVALPG